MSKYLKKNYCQRVAEEKNPKSIWQLVDTLTCSSKKKSNNALQSLANLKCNGDLNILVETINKNFQSISSDLPTIPHPQPLAESEVPAKYIISVHDMEKCLMGIKIHKAPGPDGVPN